MQGPQKWRHVSKSWRRSERVESLRKIRLPAHALRMRLYWFLIGSAYERDKQFYLGRTCVIACIIIQLLTEKWPNIHSRFVFFAGISKDLTGSFTITLHIIGGLFLLAAILFVCTHVWRKRTPFIGARALADTDVNANECVEEGKCVGHHRNGVTPVRGEAVTPL